MAEHVDPTTDDELLYRRILASKSDVFDPSRDSRPSRLAFHAFGSDVTGISLSRAHSAEHPQFLTPAQCAARGTNQAGYYLAVVRAGDVRAAGIRIAEVPEDGDPGHVELPDMNYANRKNDQVKTWEEILAQRLTLLPVLGPFPSGASKK